MTTEYSTVKWFDAKKGYGFINHPEGGDDVFVHYSQIDSTDDFKTLRTGQSVSFEMNDGPKGLHAVEVKALEEDSAETPSAGEDIPSPGKSVIEDPSPETGVKAEGIETNSSPIDQPVADSADSDPQHDQGSTGVDPSPSY